MTKERRRKGKDEGITNLKYVWTQTRLRRGKCHNLTLANPPTAATLDTLGRISDWTRDHPKEEEQYIGTLLH